MSDQPGGVVITPKAIYDMCVRTHEAVIRMEGTVREQGQDVADLKSRVRALERWWWSAAGTGLAGGAGATWLLQLLQHSAH